MTIAQQIEAKGIQKDQPQAKEAIAKKMLQEGLTLTLVSQVTGLSLEAVKALASSQSSAAH